MGEIRPRSGPGQLLALTACSSSEGSRFSLEIGRPEPYAAAAFLKCSDTEGSESGESDSLLHNSSLFKEIESVLGPCRPPLLLLLLSSGMSSAGAPLSTLC